MPDFCIGVDLGGTNLRIAAVSTQGQLLEKVSLGTNLALGRDHVIGEMCEAIQRLSGKYKATGKLRGAGIGVPGLIDMQTGMMRKAVNLPGWENYPVSAEIESRLGFPKNDARVVLENDARVAAVGEQWLGAARGVENMAVVTLGTGIGGGIVLGGKLWYGANGMAGEFGHVTIEAEGNPCACGNRGCAEQYASASAILRMAREAIASGEAPSLAKAASSEAEFGAQSIYNLAMQGDEPARRIFRSFGRALGLLLAGLVNVLNLEMYVIGGGVSSAWEAYAPSMFEELRERSIVYAATAPTDPLKSDSSGKEEGASAQTESRSARRTIITRALLGSDAGLYGAARVAMQGGATQNHRR
jgi:glucokinase